MTAINSKGFIIALMTSKMLQLQSSKSKRSSKKNKKQTKKPALHVLYVFDGTVSVVPLVAGREKLTCTFWTLRTHLPLLNNIKVNITVTPNVKPCFCLEALDLQHELSQTRWPAGVSVWWRVVGRVHWVPPAVVLWVVTDALPLSFAFKFGKETTASRNMATSVTRPPTTTHCFDTKITLAGTCNSHISGIFASVIFIMFYFCQFVCLHAVVKKYLLLN